MGRKKTYDREEVLDQAHDAFWEHGFDQVAVRALGERTGLNRFALQTDFGGKSGLFLEVLDMYSDASKANMFETLSKGGLDEVRRFFHMQAAPSTGKDLRDYGCMMLNAAMGFATQKGSEVAERAQRHYHEALLAFQAALRNSREAGHLVADLDIEDAAEFLLSAAMGVRAYVRLHGAVSAAEGQVRMMLRVIDSWRI